MRTILIWSSLAVLFVAQSKAVVILVHTSSTGVNSISTYLPGGTYSNLIKKQTHQKMDAIQWLESDLPQLPAVALASFRVKGAKDLAKKIVDYRAMGEEVTVMGHSYGGQVATGASTLLSDDPIDLSEVALSLLTKGTGLIFGIKKQLERARGEVLAYKKSKLGNNPGYLIKKMYTIVTPIDNDVLAPRMDVIEHYINIYSAGDLLITPAGVRLAELGPRSANLRAFVDDKNPKHAGLTDATFIARWILEIPDELKEKKIGGFQKFQYGHNGIVRFSTDVNVPPFYQVDNKRKFFKGRYIFFKTPGERVKGFLKRKKSE